jgi:hypothetical protein
VTPLHDFPVCQPDFSVEKKIRKKRGEGFQSGCKDVQYCLRRTKHVPKKYIYVANSYTIVAWVGKGKGRAADGGNGLFNICLISIFYLAIDLEGSGLVRQVTFSCHPGRIFFVLSIVLVPKKMPPA